MPLEKNTALQQVNDRCFIDGTAYSRFYREAPYLPRCSDNKTAAIVRPKDYAVRYPYMQVNSPNKVSWLVFDLDHSDGLIWEKNDLPAPNFIVRNRKNGHSHLYYAIVPVCTSENARAKPVQYMKAVYEAMAARLNADPSYSGPVAKTPGHPWWHTWEIHGYEYELGELADHVELATKPPWSKGPDFDAVAHSRHELLFEDLRYYAYSIVNRERQKGSFQSFWRLLDAYAHNKNTFRHRGFSMNLTIAQVKATVKSVARWTWDRYTGNSRCHRGVMQLDNAIDITIKQQLSAKRTHDIRKKNTESKIRLACRALLDQGKTINQLTVAEQAKLTRQTISKYKHILQEINKNPTSNIVALPTTKVESIDHKNNVNFGVYQITAGLAYNEKELDCDGQAIDKVIVKPP
jgi:hypothetical protein